MGMPSLIAENFSCLYEGVHCKRTDSEKVVVEWTPLGGKSSFLKVMCLEPDKGGMFKYTKK